jgi:hypothetical protein
MYIFNIVAVLYVVTVNIIISLKYDFINNYVSHRACVRLLGLWFRIPPGFGYLSLVSVVCCQVEVSASGWSFIQRSPTECDREASTMRRPWPTRLHENDIINYQFYVPTPMFTFFFYGSTAPSGPGSPHYRGFTITLRHTTLGRTPLEWPARRKDLYLTTHNIHKRQTAMPPWDSNPQSQQAGGRRPKP